MYLEAAKNVARRTGTAVDGYGSFRSCIEPVKISNGNVILYGADMEITLIVDRLRKGLINNITNGWVVMIAVVLIAVVFSDRISNELRDLVKDANAISRLRLGLAGPRKVSRTLEIDLLLWAQDT